jgi:hypothetical protein
MKKALYISAVQRDALRARLAAAEAEAERLREALREVAKHHHEQFGLWSESEAEYGDTDEARYHQEQRDFVLQVLGVGKADYENL